MMNYTSHCLRDVYFARFQDYKEDSKFQDNSENGREGRNIDLDEMDTTLMFIHWIWSYSRESVSLA